MPSLPLVSVYFISAYREDYLFAAIKSFRDKTKYGNLELLVVDSSVGEEGLTTRKSIEKNFGTLIDRYIFRDSSFCEWSNANEAFKASKGDYVVQFEDDIILNEDTHENWIQQCIYEFENNSRLGAINLASTKILEPQSVGFISPRNVLEKWHPWDCYPRNFLTITDSMRYGDRRRLEKFHSLDLNCGGIEILKTSFSAPSINMVKIQEELGLNSKDADAMIGTGVYAIRDPRTEYISINEYRERGGYKSFPLSMRELDSERLIISRNKALRYRIFVFSKRLLSRIARRFLTNM